jgi:sulfur carrier protein ThiS
LQVTVKAMGSFRSRLSVGREGLVMDLPLGSSVHDAIRLVGMAEDEPWNASIEGRLVEADRVLRGGEEILVFTPIGGGRTARGG